jgi:hypothetical protein
MQQYRLLPLLATAYAFHFTGRYMRHIYDELMRNIQSDDVSALPEVPHPFHRRLLQFLLSWRSSPHLLDSVRA